MRRNRRLERALRRAAIVEEARRRKESQEEQSRSSSEPNLFALWFPGFALGEKLVFDGMDTAAKAGIQVFQTCFKAAQRM